MKTIKKTNLLAILICLVSTNLFAQKTTLEVDNQTPGWLSSKINFSDQLSLETLKITGYINTDDISFLEQLSTKRSLQVLDLEEVHLAPGGTYRVYKYGAKKLPNGKWTRDSGYLIGKIIESVGFVPNKRYQKELDSLGQHKFVDETTDVAYGQYALLIFLSQDVYERLKTYFPYERATQIYCYGLILCANGFLYMDQIDEFYQESYLSLIFQDFSFGMGYTAISNLLHDLGMKGNPVRYFEQSLIDDSSKSIAIDGHVVRSCSQENDLAEPGYKMMGRTKASLA